MEEWWKSGERGEASRGEGRRKEITTRVCECVVQLNAVYSTARGMRDG